MHKRRGPNKEVKLLVDVLLLGLMPVVTATLPRATPDGLDSGGWQKSGLCRAGQGTTSFFSPLFSPHLLRAQNMLLRRNLDCSFGLPLPLLRPISRYTAYDAKRSPKVERPGQGLH
jgi:hypothetical protein